MSGINRVGEANSVGFNEILKARKNYIVRRMFLSGGERLDITRQSSSLYSLLDYQGQKLEHPNQKLIQVQGWLLHLWDSLEKPSFLQSFVMKSA